MANAELIKRLRGEIASIEAGASSGTDFGSLLAARRTSREVLQPRAEEGSSAKGAMESSRHQEPHGGEDRENASPSGAFSKIINLVNVSDRSERAIRERLVREGFAETDIEESIARAKDYGFIDDTRFAEVLVRSRLAQGRGSEGIERELNKHGIDIGVVPGWPDEYPVSHEEELDRAIELLKKKPPRSKNPRESAYRKLVGKGFPSSVASSAARLWAERLR